MYTYTLTHAHTHTHVVSSLHINIFHQIIIFVTVLMSVRCQTENCLPKLGHLVVTSDTSLPDN